MNIIADRSEKLEFEEQEREHARTLRYAELRSELNSTSVRVRAWEKLHGLRLPVGSTHRILAVISRATGIPVAALHEEQQARRVARTAQPAAKIEVKDPASLAPVD